MPCQTSAHSPRYFRRPIHTDSLDSYIMFIQYKNVQLHVCSEGNNGKAPPFPAGVEDQGETAVTLNCPLFYLQAQLGCKAPALPLPTLPLHGPGRSTIVWSAQGAFQLTAAGAIAFSKHSLGSNHEELPQGERIYKEHHS